MKHFVVALAFVMALPFSWANADENELELTLFGSFFTFQTGAKCSVFTHRYR